MACAENVGYSMLGNRLGRRNICDCVLGANMRASCQAGRSGRGEGALSRAGSAMGESLRYSVSKFGVVTPHKRSVVVATRGK